MTSPQINRRGITRTVILTRRWAIKLPNMRYGWEHFLRGLLANMQEREFGRTGWPGFCPVTFSLPGGWLVVMPRVRMMTPGEFERFDADMFCERGDYVIPAEAKWDSFGYLNGRIVAIDYGS